MAERDARAEWLEMVRAADSKPHEHQWRIDSGSTDGYLEVYCWCGARAFQKFNGVVYGIREPPLEVKIRQFEKRLWKEQHG